MGSHSKDRQQIQHMQAEHACWKFKIVSVVCPQKDLAILGVDQSQE